MVSKRKSLHHTARGRIKSDTGSVEAEAQYAISLHLDERSKDEPIERVKRKNRYRETTVLLCESLRGV